MLNRRNWWVLQIVKKNIRYFDVLNSCNVKVILIQLLRLSTLKPLGYRLIQKLYAIISLKAEPKLVSLLKVSVGNL